MLGLGRRGACLTELPSLGVNRDIDCRMSRCLNYREYAHQLFRRLILSYWFRLLFVLSKPSSNRDVSRCCDASSCMHYIQTYSHLDGQRRKRTSQWLEGPTRLRNPPLQSSAGSGWMGILQTPGACRWLALFQEFSN